MSDTPALYPLGYSPRWQALFAPFDGADTFPARVVRADRGSALIATPDGLSRAKPSTPWSKPPSAPSTCPQSVTGSSFTLRRGSTSPSSKRC